MPESTLLHEFIAIAAHRSPNSRSLTAGTASWTYAELDDSVRGCAAGLVGLGLARSDRVAIYLEKRFEAVVASFGALAAGCVFVPINPVLKAEQAMYILNDCDVRVLVTSPERLKLLESVLARCPSVEHVARQQVVEQHHPRPGVEGRRELAEPGIERQRQRCQQRVGGGVFQVSGDALCTRHHVPV